jgi:hypothetical protein
MAMMKPFLDDQTLARIRLANPAMSEQAALRLYLV